MNEFSRVKSKKRSVGVHHVTVDVYRSETGPVIVCKKNGESYINFSGEILKYKINITSKSKPIIQDEFKSICEKMPVNNRLSLLDQLVVVKLYRDKLLGLYHDMCSRIHHNFDEVKKQQDENLHSPGSDIDILRKSGFQKTIFNSIPYENSLLSLQRNQQ